MKNRVRDLEDAGLHMTLREIADRFILTRSSVPSSDREYAQAELYARRKVAVAGPHMPECDPEFIHVYLGRIIGEVVLDNRFCAFLSAMSDLMREMNADVVKTEPTA